MEILGYTAAAFIGITLGLIGGGGSTLTVPVMVYLFGLPPVTAIPYSLFVVGAASLVGAINNWRQGWVSLRTAALFGISSISTVFIVRRFLIPAIPEVLVSVGNLQVTFSLLTMVLFALLMLASSIAMIRDKKVPVTTGKTWNLSRLFLYGIGIGLVTGFLGAGGGFLLIPVLVVLMELPMKKAVGTSLLIIAMNSLIGFLGDVGHMPIRWPFLLSTTAVAIAGIFLGGWIGQGVQGQKLKKYFGWFVLVMGLYILMRELFFS